MNENENNTISRKCIDQNDYTFIEKIMNDYHFIVLNFVFCNIYTDKTQKMCECQNINFNKNALILFSSNYIN